MRRENVQRTLFFAALAGLALIAVQQLRSNAGFRVDDAYITFSFSKNLALGHGPTFSNGLRVEGYSNFLWMVLNATGFIFDRGLDPIPQARVLGALSLLAAAVAVYQLTRLAAGTVATLIALGLLASCTDMARAAMSGLETVAYAAALAWGWLLYFKEPADARRWSLLGFTPAALLRIDGFVPLLVMVGFELLTVCGERRFSLRRLTRWVAPALAVWALYFAWRYAYYGLPLPTTYYAKSLVTARNPTRGIEQVWAFVRDYGVLAVLPLQLLAVVRGPRHKALGLAFAIVAHLAYVARVGGDWMPFQRFFLPIVPLGVVLVGWGVEQAFRELRPVSRGLRELGYVGLTLALAFSARHVHARWIDTEVEREKLDDAAALADHTRNLLGAVDLMRHVLRHPGERLVTDYAGVFSVYTDAQIIDMWGLCNADIALHGGTAGINPIYGKECAECYARLAPDYFHVMVPLVRGRNDFTNQRQVIDNVFQGSAIDRVIGLRKNFAVGRVVEDASGRTLWFLERRRHRKPCVTRSVAPGISVEYPFELQRKRRAKHSSNTSHV